MIHPLLLIAAGGAAGALARHGMMNAVNSVVSMPFPLATLLVNASGSLLMGVVYVLIVEHLVLHPDWRQIAMVGFLGAFTTFSTFSLEVVVLLERGLLLTAAAYIGASVTVCVLGVWLSIQLTRNFLA